MGSGKRKMGSGKRAPSPASSTSRSGDAVDLWISGLHEKHRLDSKNLTLTTQPVKTLKLFTLATLQYLKQSTLYVLKRGGWVMLLVVLLLASGFVLITVDGPHEKHVQEFLHYFRFILWWVALGVASSIGLGSGLHTFVMYLGPHIALFTIKAMQCGRVDLKTAPYDTILLKSSPSWLKKNCSEFGPPVFPSLPDSMVRLPLSSIFPQVQLEAILWGVGTALGELPPYFISRAARMSGSKLDAVEELDAPLKEDGVTQSRLQKIKRWFFCHSQHLNFPIILVLASMFFIILVCNNQLLEWMENELIWILGHIPGMSSNLAKLISKLHKMKDKYLNNPVPTPSSGKGNQWGLSFASVWNSIVWLMLLNFFITIVTSTARRYLKKQQELELAALTNKNSVTSCSNGRVSHRTG